MEVMEGKEGTNWRYMAAERLLYNVGVEGSSEQLIAQAKAYYEEIDMLRPSWGLASALGAKLATLRVNETWQSGCGGGPFTMAIGG